MKESYGLRDDAVIARSLNRPIYSVRKMALEVFQGERKTGPWSAEEMQKLKRYLGRTTEEVIARILRRDIKEVHDRIVGLDQTLTKAQWTRLEIADFKRTYGTRTDEDLARVFGRPVESIRDLATQLAMAKDKAFLRKLQGTPTTRMPRWSEQELALLKQLYPTVSNLDIATQLNRSVKSVVSKAHNLRLKKDSDRLREMGRQNVSLRYGSSQSKFLDGIDKAAGSSVDSEPRIHELEPHSTHELKPHSNGALDTPASAASHGAVAPNADDGMDSTRSVDATRAGAVPRTEPPLA